MTEEQKAVSSANDAAQSQSAASEAALEAMGYKQELKRAMSVPDMLVYGLIFMVPIAPFGIYGGVFGDSGGMPALVYLVGMVAMIFTAFSYATLSQAFPVSGSVYGYTSRGINKPVGFVTGWTMLLDYLLVPTLLYVVAAQAMSGLMAITGDPDSIGGHPTMVGSYVVDFVSGVYGALGTLAALQAREKTGKGQVVDIAMFDTACSLTHSAIINYYLLGQIAQRNGNQDRAAWPANFYPTKDGELVYIHCGLDNTFARMCKVLGREELLDDPEYNTLRGRTNHIDECDAITEWTLQHTLDEIIPICKANAFPCAKVNSIEDMVKDPQLKYRKMIRDVEDRRFGTVTMSGPVVKMSDTNPDVYCTAPRLSITMRFWAICWVSAMKRSRR